MRAVGAFLILVPMVAGAINEPPPDEPVDADSAAFVIRHTAPYSCAPYAPLEITVAVESPLPESLLVILLFRQLGDPGGFYPRLMEPTSWDRYWAEVPARVVGDLGVEYYIEARAGRGRTAAGSAHNPFQVATAYTFGGDIPDELPGDDFLREVEEPPIGEAPPAGTRARGGGIGLQLILLVLVGALGYLIHERIGRG
ncbi:hypothetical protein JXA88_19450 [Candidatus Fermentibacteria bacterium]|nr:hypothetical protein [Candidatus Fermentibacteria bacterium]